MTVGQAKKIMDGSYAAMQKQLHEMSARGTSDAPRMNAVLDTLQELKNAIDGTPVSSSTIRIVHELQALVKT